MSLYASPLRLESDQKDLMISELKAENFELRNKERHYNVMYDTIKNIERECALVSEEKRAMEEEMRHRSDVDGVTIRKLREENESLFRANRDHDNRIAAIRDEIARMRAINDAKARELGDLDLSINVRMGDNNKHRDKIKDTEKFIVRECDEGRGLRIELGRTGDDISRVTADIKITESLIGQRLADIDDLNRRLNKRIIDIEDRKKDIRITEAEIARANDNIAKAKLDQDKLRCKLDDEIERNHRLNKDNDIEVVKGHKLVGNINDLEVQCKNRDAQIHIMRDEIDQLKHALHASDQCNMNLEDELDALNKHSDLLHKQNSILNSELEDAIANDEFVRRELDRRDKVAMIQRDNDEHLRSSLHMLNDTKARSPTRRK